MPDTTKRTYTDARLGKRAAASMIEAMNAPRLYGPNGELRLFATYNYVDLAHATMLAECRLIPLPQAKRLLQGLLDLRTNGAPALDVDPSRGSMLLQVESYLEDRAGADAAGYLQLARSRVDQGSAVARVVVRDGILASLQKLSELLAVLRARAGEWTDIIMPGYTHIQHSQPWVLAHWALALHDGFARDVERLLQCYARVNRGALGTAAMSGTSWAIDRQRTAAFLGHPAIVQNSKDANFVSGLEFFAEAAGVLSLLMSGLGRLASELYVWSSWEFGLVDLDDSLCATSSMMPQKKNAHALERVRALAGESIGWMAAQLGLLKTPTSTDCDLMFSSSQHVGYFDVVGWALLLIIDTMRTLRPNIKVMAERAAINWSTASALADLIVQECGLDFRRSHYVVAALVRRAMEAGRLPSEIRSAELDAAAQDILGRTLNVSDALIHRALDPVAFVATRTSAGSVGPAEVARLFERAVDDGQTIDRAIAAENDRLVQAKQALETAMADVLQDGAAS